LKQNITISLDKDLIQVGKMIAARQGTFYVKKTGRTDCLL